jgi:hypothetical protein
MKGPTLNFVKLNVRWLTAGIILVILGYILLGWNTDSSKLSNLSVFAWHKITLAPIMLLLGYLSIGIAVMTRLCK